MKVIIADDSELMRVRLKELLERIDHVEVVGEARNSIEARKLIDKIKPDVILLDSKNAGRQRTRSSSGLKGYRLQI